MNAVRIQIAIPASIVEIRSQVSAAASKSNPTARFAPKPLSVRLDDARGVFAPMPMSAAPTPIVAKVNIAATPYQASASVKAYWQKERHVQKVINVRLENAHCSRVSEFWLARVSDK